MDITADLRVRLLGEDRCPLFAPPDPQIAPMELGHDPGQPILVQDLRGGHGDGSVGADVQRVQGGVVGAGIGESCPPVPFVGKCAVDLIDGAAVFGGHVE